VRSHRVFHLKRKIDCPHAHAAHMQAGGGQLVIDPSFTIAINGKGNGRLERAVERFAEQLRAETGMLRSI